jgi:DNA-binding transcriptional MerR regulator
MITPKQVSESLTVPPSTLRRWANRFSDHLSPHEPNTHRTYTPTDLDTFRKIRDFLDHGLTYDQIENRLDAVEEPNESTALLTIADFTQMLEDARATVQTLKAQIDTQGERLEKLEKWIAQPWYKRIINPPDTH